MSRISLQNVTVTFPQEKGEIHAVEQISFEVKAGEIFGLVGLSGAGKSTLIRTINLLQRPTEGSILLDGIDITNLKGQALRNTRKKMGMIFQHFNLIQNRTIEDNLEFALKAGEYPKEKRKERVRELLKLVDLEEKLNAYPANLSGGQKQRVGIARALANNPEILLCDEATSALDVETTEEILRILEKINQELGLTIIFITHEMEVAKRLFHKMGVMENGKIVELAPTYELFANPHSEMAKKLIGRYLSLTIPNELHATLTEGDLVELHYQGSEALNPLISTISKEYDVSISIVHGKIEYIQQKPIGTLLVYLTGNEAARNKALKEIKTQVSYMMVVKEGGSIDE